MPNSCTQENRLYLATVLALVLAGYYPGLICFGLPIKIPPKTWMILKSLKCLIDVSLVHTKIRPTAFGALKIVSRSIASPIRERIFW